MKRVTEGGGGGDREDVGLVHPRNVCVSKTCLSSVLKTKHTSVVY